jgi:hypothetical protein
MGYPEGMVMRTRELPPAAHHKGRSMKKWLFFASATAVATLCLAEASSGAVRRHRHFFLPHRPAQQAWLAPDAYSFGNNNGAYVAIIDNFRSKEYDLEQVYPFGRKIQWITRRVGVIESPDEAARRDAEWDAAARRRIDFIDYK